LRIASFSLAIPGSHRGRLLTLLFLGCVVLLPGTWNMPLIDRDEPRFAEAAREMIERQDYVVPYFNNVYRFDKPPLIYWLQVACYRILGDTDFAARLPSILCTLLTGLLIYAFAWRLRESEDRESAGRFAWLAAAIYLTALQTLIHGRAAVADAAMILFTTASLWFGWETIRRLAENPRGAPWSIGWWWAFVLSLGLGFLAKGPVAWLPIIPYGVFAWQMAGGWEGLRRAGVLAALALALAIVGWWGIPALIATGGEYFEIGIGKHVVQRSVYAMEGHGARNFFVYLLTLPIYLPVVFIFFLPWSIWLPGLWKERTARDWRGYLWWWVGVVFVIFSLIKTKLPHYILPAYPALALLLAGILVAGASPVVRWWNVKRAIGAAVVVSLLIGFVAAPLMNRFFLSKQIAQKVGPLLKEETSFGVTSYSEPSLVWYLRRQTHGWLEILTEDYLERGVAIIPEEEIDLRFPDGIGDAEIVRIEGINPAKGRWMTIVGIIPRSMLRENP